MRVSDRRAQRYSFDHGFHSPESKRKLAQIVTHSCMPKPAVEPERQATV